MKTRRVKVSNSLRFKHHTPFKAVLFFSEKSNERCCVLQDSTIVGMGCIMTSHGGKDFKVLFNSEGQEAFAKIIQHQSGTVGVRGYYSGNNVYVVGVFHPPTKREMRNRLQKIREVQENERASKKVLTGQHRSHEVYLPSAVSNLSVKLEKKKSEPVVKEKRVKREKADYELVLEKEKRIEQLTSFQYVQKEMQKTGIRLSLIDMGYTVNDIEQLIKMLGVCVSYMSHRAYK